MEIFHSFLYVYQARVNQSNAGAACRRPFSNQQGLGGFLKIACSARGPATIENDLPSIAGMFIFSILQVLVV